MGRLLRTLVILCIAGIMAVYAGIFACSLICDPGPPTVPRTCRTAPRITAIGEYSRCVGGERYIFTQWRATSEREAQSLETASIKLPSWFPTSLHDRAPGGYVLEARGWPCLATYCETFEYPDDSGPVRRFQAGLKLDFMRESRSSVGGNALPRMMPLYPIWKGFAIDVLLAAGSLWIVIVLWRAFRSARRRLSNRCLNCGYRHTSRASNEPCAECGRLNRLNLADQFLF